MDDVQYPSELVPKEEEDGYLDGKDDDGHHERSEETDDAYALFLLSSTRGGSSISASKSGQPTPERLGRLVVELRELHGAELQRGDRPTSSVYLSLGEEMGEGVGRDTSG